MELEFHTEEELYQRLKPALVAKQNEISRLGFSFVTKEDIWNYLKETKWTTAQNLTLADMVDDILRADHKKMERFHRQKSATNLGGNNEEK